MVGILITSVTGSLLTCCFIHRFKWTAVKSSAILTLLFATASSLVNHFAPFDYHTYNLYFFGASFVGMTSLDRISYFWIALAGLFYCLLLHTLKHYFAQIGGALGSLACIAVIVVFLVRKILEKITGI